MATNPNSPLNDQHLAQINAALQSVAVAESQLMLAKQAKLDVSTLETQLATAKDKLLAIKHTYFPNAL